MKYRSEDIFTPQGFLADVEHNPNLDFLMNIYNIPRAFGVSGFGGNWNVGRHSVATAFVALYWSKYNHFSPEKRDRLTTQALLHDLHEAVTGDILPMFTARVVKNQLAKIQENILQALEVHFDKNLEKDLKICDLVAFLYEIKQVSPSILNPKKLQLATTITQKQQDILFEYGQEMGIRKEKIKKFLKLLDI